MTTLKNHSLFIGLLFLCLVFFSSSAAHANMAAQDFESYKNSPYQNQKWNEVVKEGLEAFHANQYDLAQQLLFKAFNLGCESPIVLFQLALLNERKESYYSAIEYYQMAKKGFAKSHRSHRYHKSFNENYGRALYFSGQKDKALPLLKRAAKRTKSYWLLKLLGMLAYENGDTLNALSYFERAVRVKSDDVTTSELVYIYTLLGRLFLNKGEPSGAYRYYNKVLELQPNHPEAAKYIKESNRRYQENSMDRLMDRMKDW